MKSYLILLILFSSLSSAFSITCANPNRLFEADEYHKNSELTCFIDNTSDCYAIIMSSSNSSLEKNITPYTAYNNSVIVHKQLNKYSFEYGMDSDRDKYHMNVRCGINDYQYNFTIISPDRYCYEVPYLDFNVCTPILTDYANFIQFCINRIDVIITTPMIIVILWILSAIIKVGYDRVIENS